MLWVKGLYKYLYSFSAVIASKVDPRTVRVKPAFGIPFLCQGRVQTRILVNQALKEFSG